MLKGRRPVGREGSRGRNSHRRMPLPSVASVGPLLSVFPVIVRNLRQPLRIGFQEFAGIPRAGGGQEMQAQVVQPSRTPPQLLV